MPGVAIGGDIYPRINSSHRIHILCDRFYLHCDPTASHYLKILLDTILGVRQFRNEIIWHYSGWNKILRNHFEKRHDIILFYGRSNKQLFKGYSIHWQTKEEYIKLRKQKLRRDENDREYVLSDGGGGKRVKRFIEDAMKLGRPVDNVWHIDKLNNSSKERLGYPTQKPEALLERIIKASSNKGDIVLDPFCGCGTTISMAQRLERKWIGIDITHLATNLIKFRLRNQFGIEQGKHYKVMGEPEDLNGAKELAQQNRYEFQYWALSLIDAKPYGDKKKGADTGIDGFMYFQDFEGKKKKLETIIIQVKSGHVGVKDIRDLGHVVDRENAAIGIFITLEEPTKPMLKEAVVKGYYKPNHLAKKFPKIQILTIKDLLDKKQPDVPITYEIYKKAKKHHDPQLDVLKGMNNDE